MAELTIRIPAAQVQAVRASLGHARAGIAEAVDAARAAGEDMCGHLVELRDAEDALAQLERAAEDDPVELTAHPELLSDVVRGALADATERFDRACEADWRGTGGEDEPAPGEALRDLLALFTLFEDVQGRGR